MRITKGIIIEKKDTFYKTRIPLIHGLENQANSVDNEDIPFIPYSTILGIENILSKGDIVYIAFEENLTEKPVILGQLSIEEYKISSTAKFKNIETKGYARLPKDTIIGDITYKDLIRMKEYLDSK